jgi:hypothetical protein
MPQGCLMYTRTTSLYIRNIIPDDVGILRLEHLANRGGAMLNFALTEFSEVRACQTRISANAWRYPTFDCEDLLTCHYQNIKQLKSQ